jgi:hypothetical protein
MNPVFYEEKDCILEANTTRINTNNQKHTSCNPAEAIHNDNFGLKCGVGERKSKINISGRSLRGAVKGSIGTKSITRITYFLRFSPIS